MNFQVLFVECFENGTGGQNFIPARRELCCALYLKSEPDHPHLPVSNMADQTWLQPTQLPACLKAQ